MKIQRKNVKREEKQLVNPVTCVLRACAPLQDLKQALPSKEPSIVLGRPSKNEALKLSPDGGMEFAGIIRRLEDENGNFAGEEFYPVTADLQESLYDSIRLVRIHIGITEHGKHFAMMQKLPGFDGYSDSWVESMAEAVELAMSGWVRVGTDFGKKSYVVTKVSLNKRPQKFMDQNQAIGELLEDKVISSLEHPVVQELGLVDDEFEVQTDIDDILGSSIEAELQDDTMTIEEAIA